MDSGESNSGLEENELQDIPKKRTRSERKMKQSRKKQKHNENTNKMPTVDELNYMRETENLFHSSLFRSQIELALENVKPTQAFLHRIDAWLQKFKDFICNLKYPSSIKIDNEIPINELVLHKFQENEQFEEDSYSHIIKPEMIHTVGSFNIGCSMKTILSPEINVDIVVELPEKIFFKKDRLNEAYLKKKKLFTCYLAHKISETKEGDIIHAEAHVVIRSCLDKPSVLITPCGGLKHCLIYISFVPVAGIYDDIFFCPLRNNIRPSWYFGPSSNLNVNTPTPRYNAIIGQDIITLRNEAKRVEVFNTFPNMKDAFILLKLWMHQRYFHKGCNSFDGYLLSMFMIYLCKIRRINKYMSSYQIMRCVWNNLAQSNWDVDGISLADTGSIGYKPTMKQFEEHYDVVFVDVTGFVNLAALVHIATYFHIKWESKLAVQTLDNYSSNCFDTLFISNTTFLERFDHIVCVDNMASVQNAVSSHSSQELKLDFRGDYVAQFLQILYPILKAGLGDRIVDILFNVSPCQLKWLASSPPIGYSSILIGLQLDFVAALRFADKALGNQIEQVKLFRSFWGPRSRLYRFEDDLCDAVIWSKNNRSLQKRRLMTHKIVTHLLSFKFDIDRDSFKYVASEIEFCLKNSLAHPLNIKYGSGEEATHQVLASFNQLSSMLQNLENAPLDIISVQGISPVFRYTDPFPPLPYIYCMKFIKNRLPWLKPMYKSLPLVHAHAASYITPIEVVIQFEACNQWPDNVVAINSTKSAFYAEIATNIHQKHKLVCKIHPEFLDVFKDGFAFRLKIFYPGEIATTKRELTEDGVVQYVDNPVSLQLEKTFIKLPILTSFLRGLHQQFLSYGPTCCLVKRWLCCQMIDSFYMPDECVDLLVASLFVNSYPSGPSFQPQTMFLRFLTLLAHTNWCKEPIIINFNKEMSNEDLIQLKVQFNRQRITLPSIVIMTPFDRSGTLWTKEQPSISILALLKKLSNSVSNHIQCSLLPHQLHFSDDRYNLQTIFVPSLQRFDILIYLNTSKNPLRYLSMKATSFCEKVVIQSNKENRHPGAVNLNPVQLYLNDLREIYKEICLFFFDLYGGNVIGVKMQPKANIIMNTIKVPNLNGQVLNERNQPEHNMDILIENFRVIGKDLVKDIIRRKI